MNALLVVGLIVFVVFGLRRPPEPRRERPPIDRW
jgi:hypothetical protein